VIEEFDFEELAVQLYGPAAVVRSRYRQRGAMGAERRDTTFRMTDVWVRHDDGWRLHVRHAQPVEGD
jgi:ketosteroid isomerase-like protein